MKSHFRPTATFILGLQLTHCASPQAQESVPFLPERELLYSDKDPFELYGELFKRIQLSSVFEDSKEFVDRVPKGDLEQILIRFQIQDPRSVTELRQFVEANFDAPATINDHYQSEAGVPIERHIQKLWKFLKRTPGEERTPTSSLIPLPHSYIVPGGRFREIYYWDSYFTMLGLLADGETELFQNMTRNFAHLLRAVGRIPNGNRDYYRGRSQPPFFSHMISLWQTEFGTESALQFLPALKREHEFWMSGQRVVRLPEGELNRYWDDRAEPRPESYREDIHLAEKASADLNRKAHEVYRDLRAGAESGWDYSTRWFESPDEFATIHTTAYVPVDLNSLLYHLELKISELCLVSGDVEQAKLYSDQADKRRKLIQHYLWDEASGTFQDYNWVRGERSPELTVAMVSPLFVGIATDEQARRVTKVLEKKFLKAGGLVTTLRVSGQQWDAPNGWAPMQWMAYAGLKRYGLDKSAERIRKRWLKLNNRVYRSTGKMMEKYNVVDLDLESGGGEYPLQDGFGWTNGVYRALSLPEASLKHLIA